MVKCCVICASDHLSHAKILLEEAAATGNLLPIDLKEIDEIIKELMRRDEVMRSGKEESHLSTPSPRFSPG